MNKIDHFEGDNDQVEAEEIDSSGHEVSSSEKKIKVFQSPPEINSDSQRADSIYDAFSNSKEKGRIFSDLSSKVVNINTN